MQKVLSFDIGGTNTRLALINEKFEIEQIEIISTITNNSEAFLKNIDNIMSRFNLNEIKAVGIGIPGVVNRKTGYIYDMPNVGIKDIPLGEYIFKKYKLPVYMQNDAEMACLAEAYIGEGKNYKRVFFITISSGLGGALVVDKENQYYVTEIGHTAYCYKGIWSEYEHLASGNYIKDLAKINGLDVNNSIEFFSLVKEKDEKALSIFKDWLKILTDFITMIQNSYYPDIITFTGGVMKEKDLFFTKLIELNPNSHLVECSTKENAGLIGGGIYAFKNI